MAVDWSGDWCRKAADQGQAEAQHNLGRMYYNGEGVDQSDAMAVEWWRKAADQGLARAQHDLAIMYDKGKGVDQSKALAAEFYRKAADQGHPPAQFNLATMHENGEGVDQSDEVAINLFILAADQGHSKAQYTLGVAYFNGLKGMPEDAPTGVEFFRKAADQGHPGAQCNLGFAYQTGKGVAKNAVTAVEWYHKAADQSYAMAQYNLGALYDSGGIGVDQSTSTAAGWYRKAADQGYTEAQYSLGCMYQNGDGVPKDILTAVDWYRKAAHPGFRIGDTELVKWYPGHPRAQNNLGRMYKNGEGVDQSHVMAAEWYRKAADQGHSMAQCSLGIMYKNGSGVPQSDALAMEWYRKAADQGNASAQHNMEIMYKNGQGAPKEESTAAEVVRKAADQGRALPQVVVDIDSMGIKALKELITSKGMNTHGCINKDDLKARAREALAAAAEPRAAEGVPDIDSMGIKALKELITSKGWNIRGCINKDDLKARAREALAADAETRAAEGVLSGRNRDGIELIDVPLSSCPSWCCPSAGGLCVMVSIPCIALLLIIYNNVPNAPSALNIIGIVWIVLTSISCFMILLLYNPICAETSVKDNPGYYHIYSLLKSLETARREQEQSGVGDPWEQFKGYTHMVRQEVPKVFFLVDNFHLERRMSDEEDIRGKRKHYMAHVTTSLEKVRYDVSLIAEDHTRWGYEALEDVKQKATAPRQRKDGTKIPIKFVSVVSDLEYSTSEEFKASCRAMELRLKQEKQIDQSCDVSTHVEFENFDLTGDNYTGAPNTYKIGEHLIPTDALSEQDAKYYTTSVFLCSAVALVGYYFEKQFEWRERSLRIAFKKTIRLQSERDVEMG